MGAIFNFLKRYKPEDPLRKVANVQQQNRIANILETIEGVGCSIYKPTENEGRGWQIRVDGSSDTPIPTGVIPPINGGVGGGSMPFAFRSIIAAGYCNVTPGAIRMHGGPTYKRTVDASIELLAGTNWIYLEIARGAATGTTPSVERSSSEPVSDTSYLRIPLCLITDAGGTYAFDRICHAGDVNFDLPLI